MNLHLSSKTRSILALQLRLSAHDDERWDGPWREEQLTRQDWQAMADLLRMPGDDEAAFSAAASEIDAKLRNA